MSQRCDRDRTGRNNHGNRTHGPRLAAFLLSRFLRQEDRDYVLGDLVEEYSRHIRPNRGTIGSHLWYWQQVIRSIFSRMFDRTSPKRAPRQKGDSIMSTVLMDVRYALRGLLKAPAYSLIAVVTLTLGIGANTAIFSVVYSVLLAPFPYEAPERLLQIWGTKADRGWFYNSLSEPNFWDFKERSQSFEYLASYQGMSVNLTGDDYTERIRAGRLTAEFLPALGVSPQMGRDFLPEEDDVGQNGRVVLLSNDFWRTRYGSDPDVLGTTMSLNGEAFTVIGVLPHDGIWLNQAQVFVPMVRDPDGHRGNNVLVMIGRLAEGVSHDAAYADMQTVARSLAELYPDQNEGLGVNFATSNRWRADSEIRLALWVLMGAVGFLLLIACVNLANLLLARVTGRAREIAVCTALGATRVRIVRRMLTESALLAAAGAVCGLLLAGWAINLFKVFGSNAVPRVDEVSINGLVLVFTLLAATITAILSGLLPMLRSPFASLVSALREGDRGVAGNRGQNRIRNILVGAEVALSFMLLVGAGLLVRSFLHLQHVDTGFESENRLTFSVNLPETGNRENDAEQTRLLLSQFLDRMHTVPQVLSAAAVNWAPLGSSTINMAVRDINKPKEDESVLLADWRYVTPEYFRTMGLSIVRGRDFIPSDQMYPLAAPPWPIVISATLANELWPENDPIGKQVGLWDEDEAVGAVVGVVEDMRERGLDHAPTRAVYMSYNGARWSPIHFVVHTSGDPTVLVPFVRNALAEFDSNLPVYNISNLDDSVANSVAEQRLNAVLLVTFSFVALVLALAGVYGVMAYSVARRTAEIGVRIALGASPATVIRRIVGQGMLPAILGIVLGLAGALGLTRFMANLLFGIEPTDPVTFVSVAALLGCTAALSCYVPARRALRVNPVDALREE